MPAFPIRDWAGSLERFSRALDMTWYLAARAAGPSSSGWRPTPEPKREREVHSQERGGGHE